MSTQSGKSAKLTRVFTTEGLFDLNITSTRDASIVGQHWNAVKEYVNTGESLNLQLLEGVIIRVGKKEYVLNIRLDEIEELYDIGELSFDDIYEYIY
jgi:hypothetical protein